MSMDKPRQYIIFNIEGEDYGIDISETNEINRLKELNIMKFPKAPAFVEGVTSIRGEVVPIINLRKKLGFEARAFDKNTRVIIIKSDKKKVGIIVDSILKAIEFEPEEISNVPDGIKDIHSKYVKYIGKKDEDIVTILDIYEILNTNSEDR